MKPFLALFSVCNAVAAALAVAAITLSTHTSAQEAATPSRLAAQSLLLDAAQSNGLMVTVGERGHILYSNDQGHNWTQADVPTQTLLTGVYLYNETLGWAVGHDATILRTQDGARTWQQVYYAPEEETPLLDVWFGTDQHGYAIGAYGLFLETNDGGTTWQQRWINDVDDFHMNHITPLKERDLFISSESGVTYLSEDNGETWLSPESPYHGSFFGALPIDDNSFFLFGLRGHLFLTHDKATSWQTIETNTTAMLTTALKSKDGNCYIGGTSGVLLIAKHCNATQTTLHPQPGRHAITAILDGDDSLILIGENGITRYRP